MQLKIIKSGFWWRPRFLIFSAEQKLLYECKKERQGLALRWHARDTQGKCLFYFDSRNTFRLADGSCRAIGPRSGVWGWRESVIRGDQCEDLFINFQNTHLHWEITTSQQQVVAAAKRMLYGGSLGYEVDVYSPQYIEEVIAFTVFFNLRIAEGAN